MWCGAWCNDLPRGCPAVDVSVVVVVVDVEVDVVDVVDVVVDVPTSSLTTKFLGSACMSTDGVGVEGGKHSTVVPSESTNTGVQVHGSTAQVASGYPRHSSTAAHASSRLHELISPSGDC